MENFGTSALKDSPFKQYFMVNKLLFAKKVFLVLVDIVIRMPFFTHSAKKLLHLTNYVIFKFLC